MFHEWLYPLKDDFPIFNLFGYITFRTGGAIMTSLLIAFLIGPGIIKWLKRAQGQGQPIRDDGPERHLFEKAGTPTMGGLIILVPFLVSSLLWGDLRNGFLWVLLLVTAGFGLIGFLDDYLKVRRRSAAGLNGRGKLLLQILIAGIATLALMRLGPDGLGSSLAFPVLKYTFWHMGYLFLPFGILVIIGSSNAVNLTDGLDGLAIVPVMIAAMSFAAIAYLAGHGEFSEYLGIPNVPGVGEIAVALGAILGAGLGFLWFNAPPAAIFMGDTGSLSLGGALGASAIAAKHEIDRARTQRRQCPA